MNLANPILFSLLALATTASADENLFGWVRGAETLPKGDFDLYETVTFRTGKNVGEYRGFDSDTEIEYGFTDRLQAASQS